MNTEDFDHKDVHTEHCCKWHGCKYSWGLEEKEEQCTVLQGTPQSFPCEYCSDQWNDYKDFLQIDSAWIEYITRWETEGGHI